MPPAAIPGSKTGADSLCRGRISTSSDSGPLSSLDRAGRQDQSFATVCVIRPGSKPPKPVAQTRWPSVRGRARSRSSPWLVGAAAQDMLDRGHAGGVKV
jgi:hypothetical protein